jgi:hypothetical protein
MFTEIDEKIKVGAIFGQDRHFVPKKGLNVPFEGKIKPVWFFWSGRKYQIKEITYAWQDRKGVADLYFFSVTDGQAVFEISFNDKDLIWTLQKVYAPTPTKR